MRPKKSHRNPKQDLLPHIWKELRCPTSFQKNDQEKNEEAKAEIKKQKAFGIDLKSNNNLTKRLHIFSQVSCKKTIRKYSKK